MSQIKKEEMSRYECFFKDWDETLIWSCLQGYMGKAYTDNLERPTAVSIIIGDFCFLAGKPNTQLVKDLFNECDLESLLVVPKDEAWYEYIEMAYAKKYEKFMRYAIKKEEEVFDKEKLKSYLDSLPKPFVIKKIDEKLYHQTRNEKWSSDLCSQFKNYKEYELHGLGYVVMDGDIIVSGASSYTVYDKGIEIEIDTKKEYRRQGLALVCAASLILECLKRQLYPSWDAANKESVALAEKLGYHFDREYTTYSITK